MSDGNMEGGSFGGGGQKRQNTENGGPASKKANLDSADVVQVKVLIPSGAVGALIGKGGESMRKLKDETNCRVQMSKNQEMYHGTHERICLVKGKMSSVMVVMRAIHEKVQEKIDANQPSDVYDLKNMARAHMVKLLVNNTSAGMVIGKSGSSIKEIREQTTSNIQVYPKAGSEEAKHSSERVITVGHDSGPVLMDAVQRILEKVMQDPMHAHPTDGGGGKGDHSSGGYDNFGGGNRMGTSGTQYGGFGGGGNAWSNQPPLVSDGGYQGNKQPPQQYGSSNMGPPPGLKFNPLQGTGNTELLTFLDNLQSTLRSSGFSESSVAEIMAAMQVLAKYNIMGLGLGLGVAAMAQMRTAESQAVAQQNALIAAAQAAQQQQQHQSHPPPQRYDIKQQLGSILDGPMGGGPDQLHPASVLIDVMRSDAPPHNFAASVIRDVRIEEGRMELEVPDAIIGAVLGPQAQTLKEVQQISGAKIDVHKRGAAPSSSGHRLISLTGDDQAIVSARLLIEKVINSEQMRRQAGTRSGYF